MTFDPWRRRCPYKHASLVVSIERDTYYCNACQRSYEGTPLDAKTDSFEVAE